MAIECSRCGFDIPPALRIKSKHTGHYYCRDLDACARRARNDLTFEEMFMLADKTERKLKAHIRSLKGERIAA